MLEQIRRELKADVNENREIPASLVRTWMNSKESDVRGATYGFFHSAHVSRVKPPLSFDEVFNFTLDYFEWCILTDPPLGGWASTRYSAGWDFAGWFLHLWDERVDKGILEKVKHRLAKLYKDGDADLRKAIEHAIIEHLFERKQVKKFFADWIRDPVLKAAYEEGALWVNRGGLSPLSERSKTKK